MITPREIRQTTFDKAVFGGYDMAGVDDFIDLLTADYTALYNETNTLKSKMRVLVETIEEYRRQQESIKKELEDAKAEAQRILAEARSQADRMTQNAEATAMASVSRYRADISAEEDRAARAKALTANYIDRMRQITMQHMQNLEDMAAAAAKEAQNATVPAAPAPTIVVEKPVYAAPAAPVAEEPSQPEGLDDATRVMNFDPSQLPPLPGEEAAAPVEPAAPEAPAVAEDPADDPDDPDGIFADILRAASGERKDDTRKASTSKFEFIDLKFGKDYDVNQQ